MTVNELIRELSELPAVERELHVEGVDHVVLKQAGSGRYIELTAHERVPW